jgi:hypothetical protein
MSSAAAAAVSATTEPTEMSSSPDIMMIVMPAATTRFTAICAMRFVMFVGLANRGNMTVMTAIRISSTPSD